MDPVLCSYRYFLNQERVMLDPIRECQLYVALANLTNVHFKNLITLLYNRQRINPNWGLAFYEALNLCVTPAQIQELESISLSNATILEVAQNPWTQAFLNNILQVPPDLHAPPAQTFPAIPDTAFKVITWNMNGMLRQLLLLKEFLFKHQPAILILTETHTSPDSHGHSWRSQYFENYITFMTSFSKKSGGVLIAVHKRYEHFLHRIPTPTHLKGHFIEISITPPDAPPVHFFGVYNPPHGALNSALTPKLFQHITLRTAALGSTKVVLGGDWNANTLRQQDHAFHNLLQEALLTTAATNYLVTGATHTSGSHLDDILCRQGDPLASPPPQFMLPRIADFETCLSDHFPVTLSTTESSLFGIAFSTLPPPAPASPPESQHQPRIIRPINKDALNTFQHTVTTTLHQQAHVATQDLQSTLTAPDVDSAVAIAHINTALSILMQTYNIAFEVLPTTQPPPSTPRPRPKGGAGQFLSRKQKKRFDHHRQIITACRGIITLLNQAQGELGTEFTSALASCHLAPLLQEQLQNLPNRPPNLSLTDPTAIRNFAQPLLNDHKAKITEIMRVQHLKSKLAEARRTQRTWNTNQKFANREILKTDHSTGCPATSANMRSMVHPVNNVEVNTPDDILHATTAHHRLLNAKKTAFDTTTRPPWLFAPPNLDPLVLEQRGEPQIPLLSKLTMSTFNTCLMSLKNGRASGNDGIPYEILKHLPPEIKEMLHAMFCLMWKTHYTPPEWQDADITLLLKKKPTNAAGNYRPITVHKTIYKLYSRIITELLSSYATEHNILHQSQDGFRPGRSGTDALQLFTLVLEDARDHKKDLYVVKLDYASAYNSVDHEKLFYIMEQIGFPADAIAVIKSIYTGAKTTIHTPHGSTPPIPQASGVLQGDTLSPLLFNIAMEPLLRWLAHNPAHGYSMQHVNKLATSTHIPSSHKTIPVIAYADDETLFSNSIASMQHQLSKVQAFAHWSGIHINPTKVEASAILHSQGNEAAATNAELIQTTLSQLTLYNKPFGNDPGHPQIVLPTTPSKYLGVYMTLTLDWTAQFDYMQRNLTQRAACISTCSLTQSQKLIMEMQCLLGAVRHSFCLSPYSATQLHKIDSIRGQCLKKCLQLGNSPASIVFLAHEDWGMGKESIIETATFAASTHLTHMLNHKGRLGTAGRASLQHLLHTKAIKADTNTTPVNGNIRKHFIQGRFLLVRMHNLLKAHDIRPEYNTRLSLIPHDELWETVNAANALRELPVSKDLILQDIMIPLWTAGIHMFSDLVDTAYHSFIITEASFTHKFPHHSPAAINALETLAHVICNLGNLTDLATLPALPQDRRGLPPPLLPPETLGPRIQRRRARALAAAPDLDTTHTTPPIPPTAWQPKVSITFRESNPDHDILPRGHQTLIIENNLIWMYNPHGQCLGTMQPSILTTALQQYTGNLSDKQTTIDDICTLLIAHGGHFQDPSFNPRKPKQFLLLPPLYTFLAKANSATTDWLASPTTNIALLNYPRQAAIDNKFSCSEAPYTTHWTGCGIVHCPYPLAQAAKAIKWALLSTFQSIPTCTIMICPEPTIDNGIHRFFHHPRVLTICQLTLPIIHYDTPWKSANPQAKTESIRIICVANAEGASSLNYAKLEAFFNALPLPTPSIQNLTTNVGLKMALWRHNINTSPNNISPTPSKAFTRAKTPTAAPPLPTTTSAHCSTFLSSLESTRLLRYAGANLYYSDGSKVADTIAAGAYHANTNTSTHIRLEGHDASLNTVFRAEAAGLLHILQSAPPEDNITIMTDSLTLVQSISRALAHPHKYTYHHHKQIIMTIIHLLLARQGHTSIHKVRAHVGISGNEQADTAAHVASATRPEFQQVVLDMPNTNQPSRGPNGISLPTPTATGTTWQRTSNNHPATKAHIALKNKMYLRTKAFPTTATGSEKLRTLLESATALLTQFYTPIDKAALSLMQKTSTIRQHAKSLAMRIRMHALPSNQYLSMFTNTPPNCELCPEPHETEGHILGHCSHSLLHSMYCKRHGQAVAIITSTLRTAPQAQYLVYADAEGFEHSLPNIPSFFPRVPRSHSSKPDIVTFPAIHEFETALEDPDFCPSPSQKVAYFYEFGMTSDRSLARKFKDKLDQHRRHQQALCRLGWEVNVIPIVMTYSGVTTTSFRAALSAANVPDTLIDSTLLQLQQTVCDYNVKILHTRRTLIRKARNPIDPG